MLLVVKYHFLQVLAGTAAEVSTSLPNKEHKSIQKDNNSLLSDDEGKSEKSDATFASYHRLDSEVDHKQGNLQKSYTI